VAGVLAGQRISVNFEGLRALEGIDIELRRKDILGLIGPNGAGKTTLVNVLTGFQRADSGQIKLNGHDATRWSAHRIARAGVARTFQAGRLFRELLVVENLEAAATATGLGRRAARARAWDILE
jgi:branched-chain amino acid transport system ATP-binding protein